MAEEENKQIDTELSPILPTDGPHTLKGQRAPSLRQSDSFSKLLDQADDFQDPGELPAMKEMWSKIYENIADEGKIQPVTVLKLNHMLLQGL